jgi:hypothetical protein
MEGEKGEKGSILLLTFKSNATNQNMVARPRDARVKESHFPSRLRDSCRLTVLNNTPPNNADRDPQSVLQRERETGPKL